MASETLQFFTYDHLPDNLKGVSKLFSKLAERLAAMTEEKRKDSWDDVEALREKVKKRIPRNSQARLCCAKLREAGDCVVEEYDLETVLQVLLEAKDCAVRAVLFKTEKP